MTAIVIPGVIIGNGTSPGPITDPVLTPSFLLKDDGFYILLDSGGKIIL